MNILPNKSRGGGTFSPKSANFDTVYPIFLIFTPKFANFAIFPPKNANLDNFFPKKCNFGQFLTSKSEKYGEIFHNFFVGQENRFLAEY